MYTHVLKALSLPLSDLLLGAEAECVMPERRKTGNNRESPAPYFVFASSPTLITYDHLCLSQSSIVLPDFVLLLTLVLLAVSESGHCILLTIDQSDDCTRRQSYVSYVLCLPSTRTLPSSSIIAFH